MAMVGLWVKVAAGLPRHPKTLGLATALQISVEETIGRLIKLWIYALEFCPSGILRRGDILTGFCVTGDNPDFVIQSLRTCGGPRGGFLDTIYDPQAEDEKYYLHDWADYSGVVGFSTKHNTVTARQNDDDAPSLSSKKKRKELKEEDLIDKTPRALAREARAAEDKAIAEARPSPEARKDAFSRVGSGRNFSRFSEVLEEMRKKYGDAPQV